MSVPIKETQHVSDPTETPIVADAYHQDVLENANQITEESPIKEATAEYFDSTDLGTEDIIPAITESISSDSDGLTFDFSDSKKRIESAFGAAGSTSGLSNQQKRDIENALVTISGTKDSKVVFGETTKLLNDIKNDDLSVSSLIDAVNDISGADEVFKLLDLEAQAAFIKSISDVVIDWGIPELIDKIIDELDDAELKDQMLEENAIRASNKGDLYITKHYCDKMGQDRSYGIHRTLITNLMKKYKIAKDETRSKKILGEEMLEFFEWLNNKWDIDPYDHSVRCLEFYTLANPNVESVLRLTSVAEYAALGPRMKMETPLYTAGKLFPDMVDWQHTA